MFSCSSRLEFACMLQDKGTSVLHQWWNISHERPRPEQTEQRSQAGAVTAATGNKTEANGKPVQASSERTQARFICGGALTH